MSTDDEAEVGEFWIILEVERILYVSSGRDVILVDRELGRKFVIRLTREQKETLQKDLAEISTERVLP